MKNKDKNGNTNGTSSAQETQEVATATAAAPVADATPAPAVPNKQELALKAVLDGIAARDLGENHPVFTQKATGENGQNISLFPSEANLVAWPTIEVGRNGGIIVWPIRSYASPFEAAVMGDVFLANQNARDARRDAAAAEELAKAAKKAAGSTGVEAPEGEPEVAEVA